MQTINQTDEIVEIPKAEYEAIKAFSIVISEQNQATEQQNIATQQALVMLAEIVAKMTDTFQAMMQSMKITVNVPEQPVPIVNITNQIPEQAVPKVTVNAPAEGERTISLKVKRDKNNAISAIEGTEK